MTTRRTPPAASRAFNKLAIHLAGSRVMPMWAKVEHVGRTSGKAYATPIAVLATADSFYVGLPWGRGTDWVRNLQRAGGGRIVWKGVAYDVTDPVFVAREEALAAARGAQRRMLERWKLDDFLRLRRTR